MDTVGKYMKVLIVVGVVLFLFFLFVIINYSNDKTYEKYKYKFFSWNTYILLFDFICTNIFWKKLVFRITK